MNFEKINANQLDCNVFDLISKKWFLITAKKPDGSFNTMTASWGGMGVLWNKNVFFCFVRPQRYTHEFTEVSDEITLSVLGDEFRSAYTVCGKKSGRNCDKITEAGLTPVTDGNFVYFEQADLVICGKKLYTDAFKESGFTNIDPSEFYKEDYHTVYICEIKNIRRK